MGVVGIGRKLLPGGHLPLAAIPCREGDSAPEREIDMRQNQPVSPRHSGSIGTAATADKQICGTAFPRDLKCLCHTGYGLADRRGESWVARQHQRSVVFKPAEHFQISAAANEQPLVTSGAAEVCNIAWQVPGHAFAGGNEAIG